MAKNEVATTEKNFNLVTLTGELKEAVAEELDGLGTLYRLSSHCRQPL